MKIIIRLLLSVENQTQDTPTQNLIQAQNYGQDISPNAKNISKHHCTLGKLEAKTNILTGFSKLASK